MSDDNTNGNVGFGHKIILPLLFSERKKSPLYMCRKVVQELRAFFSVRLNLKSVVSVCEARRIFSPNHMTFAPNHMTQVVQLQTTLPGICTSTLNNTNKCKPYLSLSSCLMVSSSVASACPTTRTRAGRRSWRGTLEKLASAGDARTDGLTAGSPNQKSCAEG